MTKSQRLLFGGISWCRLRISSSSVEKRNRKGLSGLNLFSNNSASVNVAEVIARPRKSCRHNRVASRSSNINVSPWSSGFPAWKRLEPLQAPNVTYCNHMPPSIREMPGRCHKLCSNREEPCLAAQASTEIVVHRKLFLCPAGSPNVQDTGPDFTNRKVSPGSNSEST